MVGSSGGHEAESSAQARHEEELNRIRTEGDLVLIKTQAARQSIKEVDDELRRLRQQLKDRKKQISSPIPTTVEHTSAYTASVKHGSAVVSTEAASQREIQVEERLRVAVSERAVELQKLRQAIDSARRERLDALANEQHIVNDTKQLEEMIRQSQQEVDALKAKATATKTEIARVQQEFEIDEHTFRVENQRLALEVERIAKPDKSPAVGRHLARSSSSQGTHKLSSVKHLIAQRRKYDTSNSQQMEQKVVSFEQKKTLLERILNVPGVQDLDDFIRLYNTQEQEKAEILARIEAQSSLNSSLNDSVNQLEEEITRLSGTGDLQIILRTEHTPELKKLIDSDEAQTHQWSMKAQAFSEILKTLRDPIRELYRGLVPQDRENEGGCDSITLDANMLRRIGIIEERTMQRILLKILTELENQPHSETLARFRHYQGIQPSAAQTNTTSNSADDPIAMHKQAGSLLGVSLPSVNDQLNAVNANEEEEELATNLQQLSVVHCNPTKYKKGNSTSSSAASSTSSAPTSSSAIPTVNSASVSTAASHGPNHRKTTVAVIPT